MRSEGAWAKRKDETAGGSGTDSPAERQDSEVCSPPWTWAHLTSPTEVALPFGREMPPGREGEAKERQAPTPMPALPISVHQMLAGIFVPRSELNGDKTFIDIKSKP